MRVGTTQLMSDEVRAKIATHQALVDDLAATGKTILWVTIDDELFGAIALADTLRPEAVELIQRLDRMGIAQIMLTGDQSVSAQAIANQLGIKHYSTEVISLEEFTDRNRDNNSK
jgi:P-type E1-E2 ATPase